MKKVIKLLMYALALGFVTGCATTSEIEILQSQINGLNASVRQATVDAARAESVATDAALKAEAAEEALNRAAKTSRHVNSNRKVRKKNVKSTSDADVNNDITNQKIKSSMMK